VLDATPFERLVGRAMQPWREALRAYHREMSTQVGP
jgi:hypothetical protein